MIGRVLIIAGSDSGGGAGIQGDLKTVTALGGYGMTAITALTAQNTQGVFGVHPVPPAFIAQQITLCLGDIGADAIKTGMLHSAEVIEAVAHALPAAIALIVDPVMIAKGGAPLLAEAALHALKTRLISRATCITPNLPEAECLLGRPIATTPDAMEDAAHALLALGPQAVLLKGGHADTPQLTDVLVAAGQPTLRLTAPRRNTRNTHGTGCSFASAIATGLAQGMALAPAVTRAHGYVQAAIAAAPGLGQGHGPLGHWQAAMPPGP
jgi:hydroxymethylpyrimidine/phosphomethylpyrimidine kinase